MGPGKELMELNEIIKNDKDRLFVLDNECFIIFTADDLTDEKPFIRIGNWIDLPPESIPLIENIIVTDSITGNPSHEQFNIDPKWKQADSTELSEFPEKF